jgi:DNA adenine methylase
MTRYQGGKQRIGKEIARAMTEFVDGDIDVYIEPFVGMCGIMQHMKADAKYGYDLSEDLIVLWKAVQCGYQPPDEISKARYLEYKRMQCTTADRSFAGFACNFGGVFFNGFADGDRNSRDYVGNAKKALLETGSKVLDVKFECRDYSTLFPRNSIVYCDPPYEHNRGDLSAHNSSFLSFDNDQFWKVVNRWSKRNIVFVSELTAPPDWVCIWRKDIMSSLGRENDRRRTEKLFVHRKWCNP